MDTLIHLLFLELGLRHCLQLVRAHTHFVLIQKKYTRLLSVVTALQSRSSFGL